MKKTTIQLMKFFKITLFILKQYFRIFYDYKDVQLFFTEMYIKSRSEGPLFLKNKILPIYTLDHLFPSISNVNINTFANYKSLAINLFSNDTKYLVSPRELFALTAIAKHLNPKKVFEIGTYKGWTLANLSLNLPTETLFYTIDLQHIPSENDFIDKILEAQNIKKYFGNTHEFNFESFNGLIDFIFIDAGHEKEDVMNDTEKALKMLSPNGTIVWHDYNFEHKGVFDYLNQLQKEIPIYSISDTSLAIYSKNEKYHKGMK